MLEGAQQQSADTAAVMGADITMAEQEDLGHLQQEVHALVGAVHAALQFRADQAALVQHARQLMDCCQEDTLLELVVLEGGVDAAVALLDLSYEADSSLAKAVKYACCTLCTLAARPQLKGLLLDPAACQALPGLVRLLSPDVDAAAEPGVTRRAVEALTALMQGSSNEAQELLCEAGGVDCLVLLLSSESIRTQRAAVVALHVLAAGGHNGVQCYMVECGALEGLVKVLCSCDAVMQHRALELVGLLVHGNKHSRRRALQAGAMAPLTQLLSAGGDPDTRRAAALLVGQLAAPPLEEGLLTAGLGGSWSVEHDTIPRLIELLLVNSSVNVQEMAAFAIARLAQLHSHQAAIVQHHGLPALLELLSSSSGGAQYNAAFALYELCEAPELALQLQQQGGLQQLRASQQWLQGQVKSCVDSTILRIERHLAAAAATEAAPAPVPTAATAPAPAATCEAEEEQEYSLTLAPLLVAPADAADAVGSPLAASIFGGRSGSQQQEVQDQDQPLRLPPPPVRLPSIDSVIVEEAAAATQPAAAQAQPVAQPQAATQQGLAGCGGGRAPLSHAMLAELQLQSLAAAAAAGAVAAVAGLACVFVLRHAGLLGSVALAAPALLLLKDHVDASKLQAVLIDAFAGLAAVYFRLQDQQQQQRQTGAGQQAGSDTAPGCAAVRRSVSFSIDGETPQQQEQPRASSSGSIWEAALAAAEARQQRAGPTNDSTSSSSNGDSACSWANIVLLLAMAATTLSMLFRSPQHTSPQQAGVPHGSSAVPMGAGQAVLGLALIAAAVAWLLQLLNHWLQPGPAAGDDGAQEQRAPAAQQQQQQEQTTQQQLQLLLLQQQQLLLQHQQQQQQGPLVQQTESKPPQQQQQQKPLEPLRVLSSRQAVESTAAAAAAAAATSSNSAPVPPPKHLLTPTQTIRSSTSGRDQVKQQPLQPRWQAVVAAAERKEAARAAIGSHLTAGSLAKHSARLSSSSKQQGSPAPGSAGSSRSKAGGKDAPGSSNRDQDKQPALIGSAQVSVQGRFAAAPSGTVTRWAVPLAVAVPPKRTASSSSSSGGSSKGTSNPVTPKGSKDGGGPMAASSSKSAPATPKATTPKPAGAGAAGTVGAAGAASKPPAAASSRHSAAAGAASNGQPTSAVAAAAASDADWECLGYPAVLQAAGLSAAAPPPGDDFRLETFTPTLSGCKGGKKGGGGLNATAATTSTRSPVSPKAYPWQEPLRAPLAPQHSVE